MPRVTAIRVAFAKLARERDECSRFGVANWVRIKLRSVLAAIRPTARLGRLVTDHALFPVYYRSRSSDLRVFDQIFIEREYACLDNLENVGLVLDCGANVGYSSAYFLSQFTSCTVVAIEPDVRNFAVLAKNLLPYGDRAKLLNAGIWSSVARLRIAPDVYRDGLEWSRQVVECDSADVDAIPAISITEVLRQSNAERISLLKVDIEGAEAVVFGPGSEDWLDRVDNIAIELHDDTLFGNASATFLTAIANMPFLISRSGELTICRRVT